MPAPSSAKSLLEFHAAESARLRQKFEAAGDALQFLRDRARFADGIVAQLYRELLSPDLEGPEGVCLAALGGFGRQELFPHSDIDLIFLTENGRGQSTHREALAAILRNLWDLRLRVGHTARTLAECGQLYRDNLEFNVSLLDGRYLAGDRRLFARLHDEVLPHLVRRDGQELVRNLAELLAERHLKYNHTIFHLEPNVKDAPGGLRDFHACRWLAQIAELERTGRWLAPEDLWPAPLRAPSEGAFRFLAATRCFLHLLHARDDNQLTYESQDQAGERGIGLAPQPALSAADWMRHYFRNARTIDRLAAQRVEEVAPARSSLYRLYQDWRSRVANADFAVVRGRIFPRQPAALAGNLPLLLGLLEMMARHGLELSLEGEKAVEEALARMPGPAESHGDVWPLLSRILVLPCAAEALRTMHRLGLLATLFPEFRAIDSLVIRDFYHRYTVDEHSFLTLQNLHALRRPPAAPGPATGPGKDWEGRFGEILSELERPELLFFALLFHDVGKGMPEPNHIEGSLQALEGIMARLGLPADDRETVRSLITQHLEMSAACQRRDVFDPETVRSFAAKVETPERLKMLCLLTYADIRSVNPEALTPWKAELLWQLYAATSNYLSRSVDDERVRAAPGGEAPAARIVALLPARVSAAEVAAFLDGFPRRYLATHSPEEVAGHLEMARRLKEQRVQLSLRARDRLRELTVVTPDRPFLFASMTGVLAAWGMNIVKADAFSNAAGTVLDTFRFVDLHRTLEMNPSEVARFTDTLLGVLSGQLELEKLMAGRLGLSTLPKTKVKVQPQVRFNDTASSHSTLLELIAQDRPGLLYLLSSTLSGLGCNIEIALIDTEGQKAIDVFYLTRDGKKLDSALQAAIREALLPHL